MEDGKIVKEVRQGLNGGEVDIRLSDNTFVEVQRGSIFGRSEEIQQGLKKVRILHERGAKKIEFVFGENAKVSEKWRDKVKEAAEELGISVEFKRIKIGSDGRKEWMDL